MAKKQNSTIIPLHKRKPKAREMNAGGYYDGMPGCVTDKWGNRKMIDFVVTEDGNSTALINAHPKFVKTCMQKSLTNKMLKGIVYGAVIDDMFSKKNPLNWPLRMRFMIQRYFAYRRAKKIADKNGKAQGDKEAPEVLGDVSGVQEKRQG